MIPEAVLDSLKQITPAVLDAYVLVDGEQRIVDFNRVFYSLFPRNVARQLKRLKLGEVITLRRGDQPIDLCAECMQKQAPLRYDEITGNVQDGDNIDLIAACVPVVSPTQLVEGAFVCLRNVTDEAQVQQKYKTMLEEEARARELLQQRIVDTEAELVTIKDTLNGVEKELLDFKKGLLI
jgi:PAS domain-containing protein